MTLYNVNNILSMTRKSLGMSTDSAQLKGTKYYDKYIHDDLHSRLHDQTQKLRNGFIPQEVKKTKELKFKYYMSIVEKQDAEEKKINEQIQYEKK